MDEEAGRLDIELLADVFADLHQVGTAFPAGAGSRLVAMLDPGQFRRQRIAAGPFVLPWWLGGFLLRQLGHDGGPVLIPAIDKEIPLLRGERFALATETDALVMGQFQGQLLDLQLAPLEFGIALGKLGLQGRNLRLDPIRQGR